MTTNVMSTTVDTPLVELANIFSAQKLTSVVIVDNGIPIGIISESDMASLSAHLLGGRKEPSTRDLMNTKLVMASSEKSCEHAANLMRRHKTRHIVATDSAGLLCGIFNQSDLLRARLYLLEQQYNSSVHRIGTLHRSLEDSQAALERSTRQDPLLGIGNRYAMDKALTQAANDSLPYSVAVIDIDYFKRFNDYYNHLTGDKTLTSVCHAARIALNDKAKLFRQSGNTLLALFTDDHAVDKQEYARRIIAAIEELNIAHTTAPLGRITVSVGIASCYTSESEPNHVVFRALNARDEAKHSGGNSFSIDTDHQLRAA